MTQYDDGTMKYRRVRTSKHLATCTVNKTKQKSLLILFTEGSFMELGLLVNNRPLKHMTGFWDCYLVFLFYNASPFFIACTH